MSSSVHLLIKATLRHPAAVSQPPAKSQASWLLSMQPQQSQAGWGASQLPGSLQVPRPEGVRGRGRHPGEGIVTAEAPRAACAAPHKAQPLPLPPPFYEL